MLTVIFDVESMAKNIFWVLPYVALLRMLPPHHSISVPPSNKNWRNLAKTVKLPLMLKSTI